jgi:hypothetical protein
VVSDYIVPNAEGLVVKIRDMYPQRGMCAVKYHVDKEYAESIPQWFSGILGPFKVVWLWYKPTRSDGTGSSYDEGCEGQVEDSGARFDQIIGEVEVRPCDDPEGCRVAKYDMVLYTNDHIKRGEKSRAVISDPYTVYTMKPESEVIIRFSLTSKEENVLVLMFGNLMANIKRAIKEGALDIELGQAVLGTKGTTFVVEERNGISRLKVIEGVVKFRSKATGETQLVKAGEEIYADKNGLGPKTNFNIQEELKTWGIVEGHQQTTPQDTIIQSANQIIQTYLPTIQSSIPIIGVLLILIIALRRRSKRK